MPDFLIVLQLDRMTGRATEIYNGPGCLVWKECGKMQKNDQRPISISKLQNLMKSVSDNEKIQIFIVKTYKALSLRRFLETFLKYHIVVVCIYQQLHSMLFHQQFRFVLNSFVSEMLLQHFQ